MKTLNLLAAAAVLAGGLAHGQMDSMPMGAKATASSPVESAKLTEGEVRKVDLVNGKVTLRHGPLENLGMPGMTMMFKVTDAKSLGNIKEGEKVRFRAERKDGTVVVTHIEAGK